MKIKKYIGNSIQEAMSMAKEELGQDAIVLSSRLIKPSGFLKFFKKNKVEVTAAYEKIDLDLEKQLNNESNFNDIKTELNDLKVAIKELAILSERDKKDLPEHFKRYQRILVKNGVDFNIAHSIVREVLEEIGTDNKEDDEIYLNLEKKLLEIIGKSEPLTVTDEQKTIFFVGPTGVGKTTSLAKIAASLVLEEKYDVGLITADTYRVGAVDQLRIYSEILNLPLEVVYNDKEIKEAFQKMKNKDIVLIDTAGRNHNDLSQTNDLKKILDSKKNKEIYLLISANSDVKIQENILKNYSFINDYKIIVTKIDESNNYGSLFNISYIFDREIVYYTVGQNVPEDIRTLDPSELAKKLVEER